MLMPKRKTRVGYVMVAEDDPDWCRFWNAYPLRCSKKEARKAWAQLAPSPDLVDRMVETLAWQAPLWSRQGYGTPYPASWLNTERWTDEMPTAVQPPLKPDARGHLPPCRTHTECNHRLEQEIAARKVATS